MEISVWTVVFQIVNFVLFAVIMVKFALGPVIKILDDRQNEIKKNIDDAKALKDEAEESKKQYDLQMKEYQTQAAELIANASEHAENLKKEIIASANVSATQTKERAEREATSIKEKTLREINSQIGELAVGIAGKLLESSLDKETHGKMLVSFIEKVEAGDVR